MTLLTELQLQDGGWYALALAAAWGAFRFLKKWGDGWTAEKIADASGKQKIITDGEHLRDYLEAALKNKQSELDDTQSQLRRVEARLKTRIKAQGEIYEAALRAKGATDDDIIKLRIKGNGDDNDNQK
jgi:hypothetical protein